MSRPTFTVVRNDRTSYYEVHKFGCFHTKAKHMKVMETPTSDLSGDDLAKVRAEDTHGCAFTAGPCVKRGTRDIYFIDC